MFGIAVETTTTFLPCHSTQTSRLRRFLGRERERVKRRPSGFEWWHDAVPTGTYKRTSVQTKKGGKLITRTSHISNSSDVVVFSTRTKHTHLTLRAVACLTKHRRHSPANAVVIHCTTVSSPCCPPVFPAQKGKHDCTTRVTSFKPVISKDGEIIHFISRQISKP